MESVAWSRHEGWSKAWFCAARWINGKNTLTKSSLLPVFKEIKNLTFDSSMNNRFSNSQEFIISSNCSSISIGYSQSCLIDWILGFVFIVTGFFTLPPQLSRYTRDQNKCQFQRRTNDSNCIKSHQAKVLWFTLIRQLFRCSLESVDVVHASEVTFNFPGSKNIFFCNYSRLVKVRWLFTRTPTEEVIWNVKVDRERKRKINMIVLFRVGHVACAEMRDELKYIDECISPSHAFNNLLVYIGANL